MSGLVGADNQFGTQFGHPNANIQGLLVSLYDIGCAIGCLGAFVFGETLGRRKMLLLGGSIMIVGTILLGSSYSRAQFFVGRIVTGFGNGLNSSTAPAYQSELADPRYRGALVCAQSFLTIAGLCIAYWMDYGLSFVNTPVQWRFPVSFQAFFAVCLVIQMLPLPDTPRWLIEKGRNAEAAEILARLQYQQPASVNDEEVIMLRRQIETSIEIESAGGSFRYSELFGWGKMQNLRRLLLAVMVNIFQQWSGVSPFFLSVLHLPSIYGRCTKTHYRVI